MNSYKLISSNAHTFHSGYYKSLKFEATGKEPYIPTETLSLGKPSIKQKCFYITRDHSEALYQGIKALEEAATELIKGFSKDELVSLPDTVKQKLTKKPLDTDWEIIRPNYNENNIMYLKFNEPTLEMYTWEGERIKDVCQLEGGDYQFIIRANLLYFGNHGARDAIANLQLRVVKLRYRKTDKKQDTINLMFDFTSEHGAQEQESRLPLINIKKKKKKESNTNGGNEVKQKKKKTNNRLAYMELDDEDGDVEDNCFEDYLTDGTPGFIR